MCSLSRLFTLSGVATKPSLTDRFFRAYAKTRLRGFIRLWRISGRDFHDTLRVTTSKRSVFDLSPWSYIDAIILREGYYESEVLDAITSELGSGILWDVGAHFGLHGITAKNMLPASHVVCFEPSIEMLGRLSRNRTLNQAEVDIVSLALSNRDGFQTFYVGPPGNPGMSTLSPWSEVSYERNYVVASARGDDLVAKGVMPSPTVIKLDVEGHEFQALEGMAGILRSQTLKVVVFEDSRAEDTPAKALLNAAGFSCSPLSRREASNHGLDNFVARRGSSPLGRSKQS